MKNILVATIFVMISGTSLAGNMKDLLIDHESSVVELIFDLGLEVKNISDTRFVPAEPGSDVAISSVVEVFSPSLRDFEMMVCTSQFRGDSVSGFQHIAVECK